ncbi:MAG: hypothetical protein QXH91_04150 [Candidatus Bathyarchaeia archaeon]
MFELSKLERIRDKVEECEGKLTIMLYLPKSRDYYAIVYEANKGAIYRKFTACSGDARELVEEVWPSIMLDAINSDGVAVRVKYCDELPKWFDTVEDATALEKMYTYVMQRNHT